jgi:ribonuclease-3
MYKSFNENNLEITREDINKITGFKPINVSLYQEAFIHKSVLRFVDHYSYERLEFLGDSVLNLIIAKFIFNKYMDKEEGFLTRIRTKLVNGKTLAFLANKIKLNKFLILSKNIEHIGGRNNDRILEDVFEAFLCSLFKDLGYDYVEFFVINLINEHINFEEIEKDNNYKDILLRYCQQNFNTTPSYKLVETQNKQNTKKFTTVVIIKDIEYESGVGKTKKLAEQEASKQTLIHFEVKLDD